MLAGSKSDCLEHSFAIGSCVRGRGTASRTWLGGELFEVCERAGHYEESNDTN
jgi:hypothetical protein